MKSAAKKLDTATQGANVVYGQGKSATDDAGQIASSSHGDPGVKGIAITPTSPAVARR